jgi:dimethylaniline monooxygenase (N-oxide forming)
MYEGCILNSCRDGSSFTDFPLDPARYGHYFTHRLQLRYLHEYAEHFGLVPHIRFRTEVLEARPRPGGGWMLTVREDGKEVETLGFDALFCCSGGGYSTPFTAEFKGRERFKGECFHSHYYRTPGRFEGKRVAIIGMGSSAIDIASEIGPFAKELHHITRRGVWVLPRFVLGKPVEAWDSMPSLPFHDGHAWFVLG